MKNPQTHLIGARDMPLCCNTRPRYHRSCLSHRCTVQFFQRIFPFRTMHFRRPWSFSTSGGNGMKRSGGLRQGYSTWWGWITCCLNFWAAFPSGNSNNCSASFNMRKEEIGLETQDLGRSAKVWDQLNLASTVNPQSATCHLVRLDTV